MRTCRLLLSVSFLTLAIPSAAIAQTVEAGATAADPASEIVVTGTRTPGRSRLETASPVDVLSSEALRAQGTSELG